MEEARRILTARDIMAKRLITFRADQPINDAIKVLLKHGISGAPVVDDDKRLIGIISELDCLRTLSSDEFLGDEQEQAGLVEHFMSTEPQTIEPELGIYGIAHHFITSAIRRLPVVEEVEIKDILTGHDLVQEAIDRLKQIGRFAGTTHSDADRSLPRYRLDAQSARDAGLQANLLKIEDQGFHDLEHVRSSWNRAASSRHIW